MQILENKMKNEKIPKGLFYFGKSVALLVARRTNNQPTIGTLRVRGLLKYSVFHSVDR